MLSIVTIVLFFSQSFGLIDFVVTVGYREIAVIKILVVAINGGVNLFVIYNYSKELKVIVITKIECIR